MWFRNGMSLVMDATRSMFWMKHKKFINRVQGPRRGRRLLVSSWCRTQYAEKHQTNLVARDTRAQVPFGQPWSGHPRSDSYYFVDSSLLCGHLTQFWRCLPSLFICTAVFRLLMGEFCEVIERLRSEKKHPRNHLYLPFLLLLLLQTCLPQWLIVDPWCIYEPICVIARWFLRTHKQDWYEICLPFVIDFVNQIVPDCPCIQIFYQTRSSVLLRIFYWHLCCFLPPLSQRSLAEASFHCVRVSSAQDVAWHAQILTVHAHFIALLKLHVIFHIHHVPNLTLKADKGQRNMSRKYRTTWSTSGVRFHSDFPLSCLNCEKSERSFLITFGKYDP